jgi:hypothetical protein
MKRNTTMTLRNCVGIPAAAILVIIGIMTLAHFGAGVVFNCLAVGYDSFKQVVLKLPH